MAPFVGPNELLQRLEKLEKLVEEHGRRFEELAPKGGVSRRGSRSPPRGGAPLSAKSAAAPRAVAFDSNAAPAVALRAASLYVVGGHASGQTLDVFQRFDMVAGCWELLPGMTSPRHGCSACATNGVLYVLGGADDRAVPLQTFERFDPELGRWEKLPRMPTARHGAACCSVAGLVYALGGFDGQTVLSSAERFDAARRGWETLPPLPTGRGRCAATGCEGLVLLGGGSDDTHEVAAFEEFNPSIWQWQVRPELPTARGGLAMAVPSGSSVVLAIGGRRTNGEKLDVVECYNLRRHRWSTLAPLSSPRDGCCACAFLGRVYVFGGRASAATKPWPMLSASTWRPILGARCRRCPMQPVVVPQLPLNVEPIQSD